MKDDFVVDDVGSKRWELGLELLQEGKSFRFWNIHLVIDRDANSLNCAVATQYQAENLTEVIAEKELLEAQKRINQAIDSSKAFAELVKQYPPSWELVSDYGTGIVAFYRMVDGQIQKI